MSQVNTSSVSDEASADGPPIASRRRFSSRISILIRRIHLYSGLFLVPWVVLYGVTGAMFNHLGLFPRVDIRPVPPEVVAATAMADFPAPDELAEQVVEQLKTRSPGSDIQLLPNHGAQFTGDVMFEIKNGDGQHVVHLNPVNGSAWLGFQPANDEELPAMLKDVRNITLSPDPHQQAREAAGKILQSADISSDGLPAPLGWAKLNFLASVDGQPTRITYVLKDGHIDANQHTGQDGLPLRQFFLRMHTSHGQPPHWNGRMFWSLAVDAMAIAMVCWALTGLFMWWQLKRTRLIGAVVILLSLLTAAAMTFSLHDFYATTRL
ncbi:MAG: PepSY domain-containing protein [Planctomycetaceae bacterium]